MTDRQLKSFLKAAELKSFSKAAAASYVSTPAFVQQINLLEDALGFPLFIRSSHGVRLTEAGKMFYQAADEILSIYDRARQRGLELTREQRPAFRIGCPPEQFPTFLSDACWAFQAMRPDVSVSFVLSSLSSHLQDLRNGRIALCVMAEPKDAILADLHFQPIADEHFSFCMRKDHPLSGKSLLTKDDLLRYPIICGTYDFLKQSFENSLPDGTEIHKLSTEYDMATKNRSMLSLPGEMIMIHGHWESCYSNMMTVIPSDIPAGRIGVVYASSENSLISGFLSCINEAL